MPLIAGSQTTGCNLQSRTYNLKFFAGVLAQLVERLNGIEEVTGSNPVGSTVFLPGADSRCKIVMTNS